MKKLTVTVAISAKNEEQNIKSLLKSILSQARNNYDLTSVVVVSDGSSDQTAQKVRSIKSSKIILREFDKSLGKAERLGQIYKSLTSDIVVQLDADIYLANSNFMDNLIKSFMRNSQIGMTGANSIPTNPNTFIGKSIASSTRPYIYLRDICPSLSIGPCLALRSDLAKRIKFPKKLIGEDIFAYFTCLTLGYKYSYAKGAVLNYALPQNLSEHISQNIRFLLSPISMNKYFDSALIEREDYIPKTSLLYALLAEFIKHPILASYIFTVNAYCRLIVKFDHGNIYTKWSTATSTKKISL